MRESADTKAMELKRLQRKKITQKLNSYNTLQVECSTSLCGSPIPQHTCNDNTFSERATTRPDTKKSAATARLICYMLPYVCICVPECKADVLRVVQD